MARVSVAILNRPLYSIWEAALLLHVPSATLRRWLEGARVRGVSYPPVIRAEPTGVDDVTWGEFIEAGLLRGYRDKRVPLQKMRPFIERMRSEFSVPYPLAHFKPMVDNKQLVYTLQTETELDPALFLIRAEGDQLFWAAPVQEFLETVDFDPESVVIRLHPMGKAQPVAIDPELAFGIPQIRGIRTELIAESVEAGGIQEAVTSWGLTPAEVDAALVWESSLARAA